MDDDLIPLLNMAFFYLKFRPRTIKETRDYLNKKVRTTHWSHEAVDKIINHLIEQKFLDDQEFVRYLVESRTRTKIKGVFAIKQELSKYGVEKELIDEYFAKTEINEEALAEKILSPRWPRFKNLPAKKRFEKAVNFLARRGFNFEISRKTYKKLSDLDQKT
jgi:regulatory protein